MGPALTRYYGRAAWTSAPLPVDRLLPLEDAHLRGIALHTTGSARPLGRASLQSSARRLETDRLVATRRGLADVPCQVAVDAEGRVFECRGPWHRSQANGNPTANSRYGAVTLLLGAGEQPTEAMVAALREWRSTRWLALHPEATAVVGHRDLFPTNCPGDAVQALIASGALTADGPVG